MLCPRVSVSYAPNRRYVGTAYSSEWINCSIGVPIMLPYTPRLVFDQRGAN